MLIVGGFAYLSGKVSYANTCSERFLNELPDSNLARQIRINRDCIRKDQSINSAIEGPESVPLIFIACEIYTVS